MAKINVGLRVEPEMLDELAALAEIMSERAAGAPITPSDAGRVALERGIAVLRAELGARPRRKKK